VKTLCEKLIIIDILLSHVKLNKLSIVPRPLKQKKHFPKIHAKKSGLDLSEHFWRGLDCLNQAHSVVNLIGQIYIQTIDTFNDIEAMPDAKKNHMVTMRTFHFTDRLHTLFKYVRGDGANQQKRQNRKKSGKPKTDQLKNRPSVGFQFIENRSVFVSVSVSRSTTQQ
jgi:hypothetical protein